MRRIVVCLLLFLCGVMTPVAGETLHDPLRPGSFSGSGSQPAAGGKTMPQEPDWQLTAVLVSKARLVAIVNGRTVQVGDLLQGYRVKSIERDQVVLNNKQKTVVVPRNGTGLKSPASTGGLNGKEGSTQ